MSPILDAHHHLWDVRQHPQTWMNPVAHAAINRNFVLEDLKAVTDRADVIATVVIQSVNDADETTHLLGRAAAANGLIAGVVGWADLTASDLDERIAAWRAAQGGHRLVGFRHLVQDEPDADWLTRPEVRRGLATVTRHGLTFDLLVKTPQLPAAVQIVRACPETSFVLDHLAKPPFRTGDLREWATLIRELAAAPNVYAKVSGLLTEAEPGGWTTDTLQPAIDVALEAFGVERLMFGSDWPVCLLETDYPAVIEIAKRLFDGHVSEAEHYRIFIENAARFYGLNVVDAP